jgi:hypothetical protein
MPGDAGLSTAKRQSGILSLMCAAIAIAMIAVAALVGGHPSAPAGDEGPPAAAPDSQMDTNPALLASTAGQVHGEAVDGIEALHKEQLLFHIHAHLAIYVHGQQKLIPYGIGIVPPYKLVNTAGGVFVAGGSKFYWLHTHDETGLIHIESPIQRTFTLGNLFDVWHQPLSPTQVGPDAGHVVVFVDDKPFNGDPRAVPLTAHEVIQLNVDSTDPFQPYSFPKGE